MALRLSRLYTGRPKFLKFHGHFHGWHDYVAVGADYPYDAPNVPGVPEDVADRYCVAVPPEKTISIVWRTLKADPQIGAVILEPTRRALGNGPDPGIVPEGTARGPARDTTDSSSSMRSSPAGSASRPGGARGRLPASPPIYTRAGEDSGRRVAGLGVWRAARTSSRSSSTRPGKPKMRHPGTYNANPLSASAGVATLNRVATGEPCEKANAAGRRLRNKLNELFERAVAVWSKAYEAISAHGRVVPGYRGEQTRTLKRDDNDCLDSTVRR